MWCSMSEIMLEKFKEVCPEHRLQDMYMIDVEKETLHAFEQIGYNPSKSVKKAIDKAWVNSNRTDSLYEFVYKVWRDDNGH